MACGIYVPNPNDALWRRLAKTPAPQRGNLRPPAPGPRPKGSVREQLDQCRTRPPAASSDSKSPKQSAPETQALLANSSSTVPSESSAVANSPGALVDAFFKTTDAAAQRVYIAGCAFASPCPLLSHAIRLVRHTRPALRLSPEQPPMRCIAPGSTLASANTRPDSALQVGSFSALQRAPVQAQHPMHTSTFRRGPQNTTPCL